jgi:arylsulfatase
VGEPEGTWPHDVGFDEFYGYYPAQKEISHGVDPRRDPELVLDAERLAAFAETAPSPYLVHGFAGGRTEELARVESIEDMGRADGLLADFTIAKIAELAAGEAPFFIEHCFMKVHCDNFPHPDHVGLSR